MKKKVLIIILLVSTCINAQTSFGIKGGASMVTLNGNGVDNLNRRVSVHFAGVVEFELSERFSIQPEIMFSAQGAEQSLNDYQGTWYLNYINLPLLAKYYINNHLSIEGGPYVGFLMNAKLDWNTNENFGLDELEDRISFIDYGISLGLGYKFQNPIIMGARYNLGIQNVLDSEYFEGELSHGVFQISIGYLFK